MSDNPDPKHGHRCCCCDIFYACEEKRCKAEHAAKVNGTGPYCNVCRNGIMFMRYAWHRGINPLVFVKLIEAHERKLFNKSLKPPNP